MRIVASGGLDEYQIAELVAVNAPIDIFACGTSIVAPPDASTLDTAYKLVEYDGRPVRKLSVGKPSFAARKQVWRQDDHDFIGRWDQPPESPGNPLLRQMIANGERTDASYDSLDAIRRRASEGRTSRRVDLADSLID